MTDFIPLSLHAMVWMLNVPQRLMCCLVASVWQCGRQWDFYKQGANQKKAWSSGAMYALGVGIRPLPLPLFFASWTP